MLKFKPYLKLLAIMPFAFGFLPGTVNNNDIATPAESRYILTRKEMSLDNRYPNSFVNDVFKKNILLNLAYASGKVSSVKDIVWEEITKPFQFEFSLEPSKTFAFHQDVAEKYRESLVKTTNAHFNALEGFKTDGYLFGDGVCHLASLINQAAQEAGLTVEAQVNHDFAQITDIPKNYGVSIYYTPGASGSNSRQNLYITNNKGNPVTFKFAYLNNKVSVEIVQ